MSLQNVVPKSHGQWPHRHSNKSIRRRRTQSSTGRNSRCCATACNKCLPWWACFATRLPPRPYTSEYSEHTPPTAHTSQSTVSTRALRPARCRCPGGTVRSFAEPGFYGILEPNDPESGFAGQSSRYRHSAAVLTLQQAGPVPHYVTAVSAHAAGSRSPIWFERRSGNRHAGRLALGQRRAGTYRVAAGQSYRQRDKPHDYTNLSEAAVRYGQLLAADQLAVNELAQSLYAYNAIPISAEWRRQLPTRTRSKRFSASTRVPCSPILTASNRPNQRLITFRAHHNGRCLNDWATNSTSVRSPVICPPSGRNSSPYLHNTMYTPSKSAALCRDCCARQTRRLFTVLNSAPRTCGTHCKLNWPTYRRKACPSPPPSMQPDSLLGHGSAERGQRCRLARSPKLATMDRRSTGYSPVAAQHADIAVEPWRFARWTN